MERIGRNVKRHRLARGWTQRALAERVGTSSVYVAQIESAAKEISIQMLGKLAKALGIKPGRLLD